MFLDWNRTESCAPQKARVSRRLTHGGWKNDDPQHVHAFAGAGRRLHDDVRRRRQIQGEVLHVGAVVVLDAVYVDPARGGLVQKLSHSGFGDELRDSLGSILETRAENSPNTVREDGFYGQPRRTKLSNIWSVNPLNLLSGS